MHTSITSSVFMCMYALHNSHRMCVVWCVMVWCVSWGFCISLSLSTRILIPPECVSNHLNTHLPFFMLSAFTHSLSRYFCGSLCFGIDKYCVCYANWTFNYQKRYKFCVAKEIIKCFWVQVVVVHVHRRRRRRHRHIIFSARNVYSRLMRVFYSIYSFHCFPLSLADKATLTHAHTRLISRYQPL